jgi:hypothetical protein
MPQGIIRVAAKDFPAEEQACLRCGAPAPMMFVGPCPSCTEELRAQGGEQRDVDATYVPKMNVTPNAVALKD